MLIKCTVCTSTFILLALALWAFCSNYTLIGRGQLLFISLNIDLVVVQCLSYNHSTS